MPRRRRAPRASWWPQRQRPSDTDLTRSSAKRERSRTKDLQIVLLTRTLAKRSEAGRRPFVGSPYSELARQTSPLTASTAPFCGICDGLVGELPDEVCLFWRR
jgi:hypothetical protein